MLRDYSLFPENAEFSPEWRHGGIMYVWFSLDCLSFRHHYPQMSWFFCCHKLIDCISEQSITGWLFFHFHLVCLAVCVWVAFVLSTKQSKTWCSQHWPHVGLILTTAPTTSQRLKSVQLRLCLLLWCFWHTKGSFFLKSLEFGFLWLCFCSC